MAKPRGEEGSVAKPRGEEGSVAKPRGEEGSVAKPWFRAENNSIVAPEGQGWLLLGG